jgi:exodeoxyribonuclease VII large subunit
MTEHIERERWQLQALARTLGHLSPRATVDNSRQRVDLLYGRLGQALENEWRQANGRLTLAEARLSAISPLATLSRGYSIVRGPDDQIIRSVKAVTGGDKLTIQVIDGEFDATVDGGKGRDGRVAEPKL